MSKALLVEDDAHISGFECYNCICFVVLVSPSGLSLRLVGFLLSLFHNVDERLSIRVWIASFSWEGFRVVLKISITHQVMLKVWFPYSSHKARKVVVELPLPYRSFSSLHTLGEPMGMNTGAMAYRQHDHFKLVS